MEDCVGDKPRPLPRHPLHPYFDYLFADADILSAQASQVTDLSNLLQDPCRYSPEELSVKDLPQQSLCLFRPGVLPLVHELICCSSYSFRERSSPQTATSSDVVRSSASSSCSRTPKYVLLSSGTGWRQPARCR